MENARGSEVDGEYWLRHFVLKQVYQIRIIRAIHAKIHSRNA